MRKVYTYMAAWLIALIMTCASLRCGAQDSTLRPPQGYDPGMTTDTVPWKPYYYKTKDTIANLEYVTVNYFFSKKKLYHVRYIVYNREKKWYYYPNHEPVHLINYKQKGCPEVIVKYKP